MHTMQRHAIAAGKPGGGFGAAASGQISTTKENGGFSFKPTNSSPAGDSFFCLLALTDVEVCCQCGYVDGTANSDTSIEIPGLSSKQR